MEKELLTLLQKEFPITQRPFKELAKRLNSTEEEVLDLYKRLKEDKIIRQTSAIFDTKSLGYKSSLVAFKVKDPVKASEFINSHPGVSHNYERTHEFNLWFTIAVEPTSSLGLEETVKIMAKETNAKDYLLLPTLKMFKIKVQLNLNGKASKKEKIEEKKIEKFELEPLHYKLILALQEDISPSFEPFEKVVKEVGIDYPTLEKEAKRLKEGGYMRRFASILYHRRAGFKANAMVVWDIDEERALEEGKKVAQYSAVSHCYLRPTYPPKWNYNLFSMIHAQSKEEVEELVEEIAKEIKPNSFDYIYSTKEFKKQRIKYFSPEFKKWEEKYGKLL